VEVHYHFVGEKVLCGEEIEMKFTRKDGQVADIFMKGPTSSKLSLGAHGHQKQKESNSC